MQIRNTKDQMWAILTSDKIDYKSNKFMRDKEGH